MLFLLKPKYLLYGLLALVVGYFLFCYVIPAGVHIGRFRWP